MSIQSQQILERAPRFCIGAAVSVFLIAGTLAALGALAALGIGLVEW